MDHTSSIEENTNKDSIIMDYITTGGVNTFNKKCGSYKDNTELK